MYICFFGFVCNMKYTNVLTFIEINIHTKYIIEFWWAFGSKHVIKNIAGGDRYRITHIKTSTSVMRVMYMIVRFQLDVQLQLSAFTEFPWRPFRASSDTKHRDHIGKTSGSLHKVCPVKTNTYRCMIYCKGDDEFTVIKKKKFKHIFYTSMYRLHKCKKNPPTSCNVVNISPCPFKVTQNRNV